jgi:hypothetical protein
VSFGLNWRSVWSTTIASSDLPLVCSAVARSLYAAKSFGFFLIRARSLLTWLLAPLPPKRLKLPFRRSPRPAEPEPTPRNTKPPPKTIASRTKTHFAWLRSLGKNMVSAAIPTPPPALRGRRSAWRASRAARRRSALATGSLAHRSRA